MKIAFIYSQPRKSWERKLRRGNVPDHIFYGYSQLRKTSHKVRYWDKGLSKKNWLRWPISPLQQLFINKQGIGFQLDQALKLLPKLKEYSAIITTNDSCGLPIALLKKLKLLNVPQIYFHIDLERTTNSPLNNFVRSILQEPETIVSFSIEKKASLINKFSVSEKKIHFIPPGVDTSFFKPKKTKNEFDLVAIGRDVGRDYQSLFKAIKKLNISALVICDPKNLTGLTIPGNVQVKYSVSYLKVRRAYHNSKIVVVPTLKNSVSGQINFLEALSCGKPILAADTPALHQTFDPQTTPHCLFYKPQNTIDLRKKIKSLLSSRQLQKNLGIQARKTALKHSSRIFASKVTALI